MSDIMQRIAAQNREMDELAKQKKVRRDSFQKAADQILPKKEEKKLVDEAPPTKPVKVEDRPASQNYEPP